MRNAIEVVNVSKSFNGFKAVDNVSFTVMEGEIFGFLGPNGAGKTTTTRMITGLIKPDHGEIRVFGFDILREPVKAKQIMGIIPEMSNAYIDLSAWDNLMLVGGLYGVPRKIREERGELLLKQFKLFDRRSQLVKGFSKGMKQRLLMCMALIHEPILLVLDEPTSGLDVESTILIREVLRGLNKRGVTVFITTHNMEEASKLCERVAIINHGRIIVDDTVENVKNGVERFKILEIVFDRKIDFSGLAAFSVNGRVDEAGERVRLTVGDVGEALNNIIEFANSKSLKIISLNTLTPSLEEAFIKLTGAGKL
ncbi:MAG: ATP-binding cassette domain-containing protein [Candidatus Odinarchaeum yellowstonii]|uniref:ATP-binding cassette domain-containing protein n=1 Tax=Odinarchaeota yellowstonii (strain LCB_4) TaxID=1841599 RepID=A0AAF0D1V7_ODILC|nr:MAG: ATP-binding cassette domain-containing protein [Candidatus Odinarchaeum yellowstonii]